MRPCVRQCNATLKGGRLGTSNSADIPCVRESQSVRRAATIRVSPQPLRWVSAIWSLGRYQRAGFRISPLQPGHIARFDLPQPSTCRSHRLGPAAPGELCGTCVARIWCRRRRRQRQVPICRHLEPSGPRPRYLAFVDDAAPGVAGARVLRGEDVQFDLHLTVRSFRQLLASVSKTALAALVAASRDEARRCT
jgi:hypothetical protein